MIILSLLLVVAVVWTLVSIFSAADESEITTRAAKVSAPLNTTFDESVFSSLESKPFYDDQQLTEFPINVLLQDRSGNFIVLPYDTAQEEIDRLTEASQPAPRPRPTAASATATQAATTSP